MFWMKDVSLAWFNVERGKVEKRKDSEAGKDSESTKATCRWVHYRRNSLYIPEHALPNKISKDRSRE
jgi:hypothetical protein